MSTGQPGADGQDREHRGPLDLAARLAVRGWGRVEPNPMVGCVLVAPGAGPWRARAVGMGHHRVFGGPHAEAEALANARSRGLDVRGCTAYCTLEPCAASGKQPACAGALIEAGIARVVCAASDPTPGKGGGAAALRAAGVEVVFSAASERAVEVARPWLKRVTTGMPWVVLKWAQTLDGKIATRTGESRWISGERSRRWVHLGRGRVDAVLTGIGTVRADDPRLDARGVPVRRRGVRVVVDPGLELNPAAAVYGASGAAGGGGVIRVACEGGPACRPAGGGGEEIIRVPGDGRHVDLKAMLAALGARGIGTVLCECGPGLTSALLAADLVDEVQVFVAPLLMGDAEAKPAVRGLAVERLAEAKRFVRVLARTSGPDTHIVLRRAGPTG